jgi:hypothetical protein
VRLDDTSMGGMVYYFGSRFDGRNFNASFRNQLRFGYEHKISFGDFDWIVVLSPMANS